MRLLRTAAGGFVNAERIVCVVEADEGPVAVLADDTEAALAPYYRAPGRLARELPEIIRAARGASGHAGAEDIAESVPANGCAAEACCGVETELLSADRHDFRRR